MKNKTEEIKIDFPDIYRVVGGDISLKRPGFSIITINKQADPVITKIEFISIDNKKNTKKTKGQLLDDIIKKISVFFPDERFDHIPTYFVKEKFISSHHSQNESTIYESVGLCEWYIWHMKKTWYELYPVTIKKLITGKGKAEKEEVAKHLENYVGKKDYPDDDCSDAVAVAIAWLIQNNELKGVYPDGE